MSSSELLQVVKPAASSGLAAPERARLVRRARMLAWLGILWHVVECAIAVVAGLAASSIALIGFGIDSPIESRPASSSLWLFASRRRGSAAAERRAQRLIAGSFFLLAVYVGVEAGRSLAFGSEPTRAGSASAWRPSPHRRCRYSRAPSARVGRRLGSSATVSEGAQTMLCAYLSIGLLLGLGANAVLGWWWADPLCALAIAGVAVREGVKSWRGEADACCLLKRCGLADATGSGSASWPSAWRTSQRSWSPEYLRFSSTAALRSLSRRRSASREVADP